jgi:hypothetical protein
MRTTDVVSDTRVGPQILGGRLVTPDGRTRGTLNAKDGVLNGRSG